MSWFWSNKGALCGIVFLAAQAWPHNAFAQTFIEHERLSFGTIAIASYNAVGRVTVDPSGTYSHNSNVYLMDPPHLGEYELQGFDPDSFYTVVLPDSVVINGPGGPFMLDNLQVQPATLVTDENGNDTFTISGRLQTLGSGTAYGDGDYSQTYTITLSF